MNEKLKKKIKEWCSDYFEAVDSGSEPDYLEALEKNLLTIIYTNTRHQPEQEVCMECGGKGVIPSCENCSKHRWTGAGGGASYCHEGHNMRQDKCEHWRKTKSFISDHNKCPSCNGTGTRKANDLDLAVGVIHPYCHSCQGTGKSKPDEVWVPDRRTIESIIDYCHEAWHKDVEDALEEYLWRTAGKPDQEDSNGH